MDGAPATSAALKGGILRSDERIPLAHRRSDAKYAAAFSRNAIFCRISRFSRSSSRNRARSDSVNAGSSSACSCRYAFTQFPKVVSCMLISRATAAIAREFSTTSRTAVSRNSGEKFFLFFGTLSYLSGTNPTRIRSPEG